MKSQKANNKIQINNKNEYPNSKNVSFGYLNL